MKKKFATRGSNHYKKNNEEAFFSILPTATQYARNAIFSGLMPSDMEKLHPEYWKNDTDEGGKNLHEADFLREQMKRLGLNHVKHEYHKITNLKSGKKLVANVFLLADRDKVHATRHESPKPRLLLFLLPGQ